MSHSGRLLLVSDLEGCKVGQSQVLCSQPFFENLAQFLSSNPANKVAFLGDYFDQGPLVVDSINFIMKLREHYGERVIIILGNRDLNKFRLMYELDEKPQSVDPNGSLWPVWKAFYPLSQHPNIGERLNAILTKSMGALWPPQLDPALNEYQACYLLLGVFSEKAAELFRSQNGTQINTSILSGRPENNKYIAFIKNCRDLFNAGKIVHYDNDFKTLLSHAGGMDSFLFHNIVYYSDLMSVIDSSKDMPYYNIIENVRLALQTKPAPHHSVHTFDENTYNAPLDSMKAALYNQSRADKPPSVYYLLQGLGLKPNAGEHFCSFVQSCDIQSCKGPIGSDIKPYDMGDYKTYMAKLIASNIRVVAAGHSPHCVPIPLIYRRPHDDTRVLFIANDTSNGYRPMAIDSVEKLPLAYVTANGLSAGVLSTGTVYRGEGNLLNSMIGEWSHENAPVFTQLPNGEPGVLYSTGDYITFPARKEAGPPGIFKAAVMVKQSGGSGATKSRARSRKSRKGRKSRTKSRRFSQRV